MHLEAICPCWVGEDPDNGACDGVLAWHIWMALLTAVMVHERTRPRGRESVPVTGVALLGAAAVVLPYSAYAHGVI